MPMNKSTRIIGCKRPRAKENEGNPCKLQREKGIVNARYFTIAYRRILEESSGHNRDGDAFSQLVDRLIGEVLGFDLGDGNHLAGLHAFQVPVPFGDGPVNQGVNLLGRAEGEPGLGKKIAGGEHRPVRDLDESIVVDHKQSQRTDQRHHDECREQRSEGGLLGLSLRSHFLFFAAEPRQQQKIDWPSNELSSPSQGG